jgi:hypothetical protein
MWGRKAFAKSCLRTHPFNLIFERVEEENGRGDWIRTNDPLLPKQVRYQAALRPDTVVWL